MFIPSIATGLLLLDFDVALVMGVRLRGVELLAVYRCNCGEGSSATVVVFFSEPLIRKMSSENLRVGQVRVGVVLGESDSVVISDGLSCLWFHDALQE